MSPVLAYGEAFLDPGPLTCALMQDIGWTLGPGCNNLVVDTEDAPLASGALTVEPAGPNPFREATELRVRLGEPQALRATLHDAVGREVGVLYDGTAASSVTLRVDGDLAPGVYVVRVQAETGTATAPLVRIR